MEVAIPTNWMPAYACEGTGTQGLGQRALDRGYHALARLLAVHPGDGLEHRQEDGAFCFQRLFAQCLDSPVTDSTYRELALAAQRIPVATNSTMARMRSWFSSVACAVKSSVKSSPSGTRQRHCRHSRSSTW